MLGTCVECTHAARACWNQRSPLVGTRRGGIPTYLLACSVAAPRFQPRHWHMTCYLFTYLLAQQHCNRRVWAPRAVRPTAVICRAVPCPAMPCSAGLGGSARTAPGRRHAQPRGAERGMVPGALCGSHAPGRKGGAASQPAGTFPPPPCTRSVHAVGAFWRVWVGRVKHEHECAAVRMTHACRQRGGYAL